MLKAAILIACAAAGIVISVYMTLKFYRLKNAIDSEESIVQTAYARVFGVPNSLLGIFYYCCIAGIALYRIITGTWILIVPTLVVAVSTVAFSIYLVWSLIVKLKKSCPLCFSSHILNLIISVVLIVVMLKSA